MAKLSRVKPVRPAAIESSVGHGRRLPVDHEGMTIVAVSPGSDEARELIAELDREIASLYPESTIDGIVVDEFERAGGYFVIARHGGRTLGCGGFRPVDAQSVEIKRMFVKAEVRRCGVGRRILHHLEDEVRRRGFDTMVLETGCNNAEARALYESEGYAPIPAFLGYVGITISRCYAKRTGATAVI